MKKKIIAIVMAIASMGIFAACSSPTGSNSSKEVLEATVNKEKKEVIIPAEVNGKYFKKPTRHGVVFMDGSNGEKSILRGLSDEKKFHDALVEIGAKPGNNLTMEAVKASKEGLAVDGAKLDVFVTWEGANKEVPFADIVKASEERPMDLRFGGNLERAKDKNTGCILCLDSCPVGIVSNASFKTGSFDGDKVEFTAKEDVLPADGTRVSVIFRLAE